MLRRFSGRRFLRFFLVLSYLLSATAFGSSADSEFIAVTQDSLLQTASEHLFDLGILNFAWGGDSKGIIARIIGPPNHGDPSGKPQKDELQYIALSDGARSSLGQGAFAASSPSGDFLAIPRGVNVFGSHNIDLSHKDGRRMCSVVVSDLNQGASGFDAIAWSTKGDKLALAISSEPPVIAKSSDETVSVYDGDIDTPISPSSLGTVQLWTSDAACGHLRKLAELPYAELDEMEWARHDGILVANVHGARRGRTHGQTDLIVIDVADGTWHVLVPNIGGWRDGFLKVSSDSKHVAFSYDEEGLPYIRRQKIAVMGLGDKSPLFISNDLRGLPQWDPLNGRLWLTVMAPHESLMYKSNVTLQGQETVLPSIPGDATLSPSGAKVAWVQTSLAGESDLWVADIVRRASGTTIRDRRLLLHVPAPLAAYARGKRTLIEWPSTDGLKIAGILVLPISYSSEHRYPLIVSLHGGPFSGLTSTFDHSVPGPILNTSSLEHDMWANKGYAVLISDYRESSMYGFEAINSTRSNGTLSEKNYDDVMSGVDMLVKRGIADDSKLAIVGHSAGAMLTNWILTHTNRFKAGVTYEGGFASILVSWGALGEVNEALDGLWGNPFSNPETYKHLSPLYTAGDVSTPTLFISSNGGTWPGDLNAWLYAAWRYQGVEAEYCVYSQEGHVVSRLANQRDLLRRSVAWIDRHTLQE
jgi:dipeptidyl aminopeptidase/acylaminoacyl peptidase